MVKKHPEHYFEVSVKKSIIFLLSLLTTGCVNKYIPPNDDNFSILNIKAQSDAKGTIIRSFSIYTWENDSCADPRRIDYDSFAGKYETFNEIKIPAGSSFLFAVRYGDAILGMNRSCSVTNSFVPKRGKMYQATFKLNDIQKSCVLDVKELASNGEKDVTLREPKATCLADSQLKPAINGVLSSNKPQLTIIGQPGSSNMVITTTP